MKNILHKNLIKLQSNEYPGRGIVIGMTPDGTGIVQVYWIMGRSDNSRNRILMDNLKETLDFYWDVLNKQNRISVLVKYINLESNEIEIKIKNKLLENE